MNENVTYVYRQKSLRLILSTLLFGAGGYVSFGRAFTEDRGLELFRIITLGPMGADIFWFCLGVLATGMVIAVLVLLYVNATTERAIVLRPRAMTLPRHILLAQEVTIPYRDITSVKIGSAGRNKYIRIKSDKSKVIVHQGVMPDYQSFVELYQEIVERVRRAETIPGGLAPAGALFGGN
ncbi:hypothetical protein [Dongia sp.]|uniref:hypothetical protein n=1 Tax=Dongia sp. TaxID=1977262 RepID=UPI0035B0B7F5